jgi:hypothetical protein
VELFADLKVNEILDFRGALLITFHCDILGKPKYKNSQFENKKIPTYENYQI